MTNIYKKQCKIYFVCNSLKKSVEEYAGKVPAVIRGIKQSLLGFVK